MRGWRRTCAGLASGDAACSAGWMRTCRRTGHNPVDMLGRVSRQRLAAAVEDGVPHLNGVVQRLQRYLAPDSTVQGAARPTVR
jgi:hypothetical protein